MGIQKRKASPVWDSDVSLDAELWDVAGIQAKGKNMIRSTEASHTEHL